MGNANSHDVAFLVEPMEPLPIVARDFCFLEPTSLVIPPSMSRTPNDCMLQTVTGEVVFLWRGKTTTLTNVERSISMQMERKALSINAHSILVDGNTFGPSSGWLADINVIFPSPSVYEPRLDCTVGIHPEFSVAFSVEGDWGARNAVISMHVRDRIVSAARIRGVKPGQLFGEYILDVIPGVDVAFMVLLCTSIDRIANLTRGIIL
ncbi:Aste57867_13976 [Aphanomyces stellatus]|uniref:Aste57867_13976 protein n=1 Tax=Aphanomyces stellatus TaxID=120398 RepID=A0A485L082_9STRA|nr:hypothetical protein As57867_013925 [Aphanomyces stellatus]VFT90806.1 Aste57867_13976 [Aphanomyces stellatus]